MNKFLILVGATAIILIMLSNKSKAEEKVEKLSARYYIVKPGDYLRKIALEFYGDESKWQQIYSVNKGVIGNNPDLILPGQRLVIP